MQRVADLLEDAEFEAALVRLWILADDKPRLNRWEQQRDALNLDAETANWQRRIQTAHGLDVARMETTALALIRAIDTFLASKLDKNLLSSEHFDEGGKQYWLIPQHLNWRNHTATARQPGSKLAWFRHFVVIPAQVASGQAVQVYTSKGRSNDMLTNLREAGKRPVKIWIADFTDAADVTWDKSSPSGNWRTVAVKPAQTRSDSLVAQLQKAKQMGANFVVFPEFSLDTTHRSEVLRWLQNNDPGSIVYIVPGSFHEGEQHVCFNTAPLIQRDGKTVFTHQKLRLFGKDGVAEHVEIGNTLHVLTTPLGCLTVLICKDFMDEDASVVGLLQSAFVDWALVPSYGDEKTVSAHQERAKKLAYKIAGVNSAVANTRNTAMAPQGSPLPGFGHASGERQAQPVSANGGMAEYPLPKKNTPASQ